VKALTDKEPRKGEKWSKKGFKLLLVQREGHQRNKKLRRRGPPTTGGGVKASNVLWKKIERTRVEPFEQKKRVGGGWGKGGGVTGGGLRQKENFLKRGRAENGGGGGKGGGGGPVLKTLTVPRFSGQKKKKKLKSKVVRKRQGLGGSKAGVGGI